MKNFTARTRTRLLAILAALALSMSLVAIASPADAYSHSWYVSKGRSLCGGGQLARVTRTTSI